MVPELETPAPPPVAASAPVFEQPVVSPVIQPEPEPAGDVVEEPPVVFDAFESAFSEPIESGAPEPVVSVVPPTSPPASSPPPPSSAPVSPPLPTHSPPSPTTQVSEDNMFFGAFQSPSEQQVEPVEELAPSPAVPPLPSPPSPSSRPVQVNVNELATGLQPPPPVRGEIATHSPPSVEQQGEIRTQSPSLQPDDPRAGMCTGCLVGWRSNWKYCPVCGSNASF